jgi:hypothetical protein
MQPCFVFTILRLVSFLNLPAWVDVSIKWALPGLWARALGSDRNDILITQDSQNLRWKERSPGNIGGHPSFRREVKLPKAYHSGTFANTTTYTTELEDPGTEAALRALRDFVASPDNP